MLEQPPPHAVDRSLMGLVWSPRPAAAKEQLSETSRSDETRADN